MIDVPMLLFRQLGHLQLTFDVISSCCIRSQWNASLKSPPDIIVTIIVTVPLIYQMAVHWKNNLSGHFYAQIGILGFGHELKPSSVRWASAHEHGFEISMYLC